MSGSSAGLESDTRHRSYGGRQRGGFRVVMQLNDVGEEIYVVVSPTDVPMYSFTDVRDASAEAAALNIAAVFAHGS
jgi:hypothetical protein